MNLGLNERAAIVTGASKGIGFAIAATLAEHGCRLCMVSRSAEALGAAAETLRREFGADALVIAGDVADASLGPRVIAAAVERWGRVDILINNAGGPPPGSFLDHDEATWRSALDQNFMSVVRFIRAAAPLMKERNYGRIVNITSTIAKEPTPQMVLSASARAAVSAFSKAVSTELAPFNITVNSVAPGGVRTDRLEALMSTVAAKEGISTEQMLKRAAGSIPIGRFAEPREIAEVVAFLVSERASYLTGLSLMTDAGLTKSVF